MPRAPGRALRARESVSAGPDQLWVDDVSHRPGDTRTAARSAGRRRAPGTPAAHLARMDRARTTRPDGGGAGWPSRLARPGGDAPVRPAAPKLAACPRPIPRYRARGTDRARAR